MATTTSAAGGSGAGAGGAEPFRPAAVGDKLEDVETPALCIDLDMMEANMAAVNAEMAKTPSVMLRPHFKSHKSSELAALQIATHSAAGVRCIGMCAQKVIEAEALVRAGVRDVFVSNQVVGLSKIRRLHAVACTGATVSVVVDNLINAKALSAVFADSAASLRVLVEMDVGQRRCGVSTPEQAADLAAAVSALPGLQFHGLQAYHGMAQHIRTVAEREAVIAAVATKAKAAVDAMVARGIECSVVTGGGTGTFWFEAGSGVFNEVQPGSYLFTDADYDRNEASRWKPSMFLLATVMSVNDGERRGVLDLGLKATSLDSGLPSLMDLPDHTVTGLTDEHATYAATTDAAALPALGTKLRLQAGHVDPTCNHHDWLVGVRGGVVERLFRVDARSPGY